MKLIAIYLTILFYSTFAFAFSAVCPAICVTIGPDDVCELICGEESQPTCCEPSCTTPCPEVDALAFCYGAYGTQNSLRSNCACPVEKQALTAIEAFRFFKDVDAVELTQVLAQSERSPRRAFSTHEATPSNLSAQIIAITVLRI